MTTMTEQENRVVMKQLSCSFYFVVCSRVSASGACFLEKVWTAIAQSLKIINHKHDCTHPPLY